MSQAIIIAPFRSLFYLSFRNATVQRWAARYNKSNYYSLTPKLWKVLGLGELPDGTAGQIQPNQTLHFASQDTANAAMEKVVEALKGERILK